MQGNVNIPDSTITTNLSFRQLVLMNMQQLTNFPYIEKDFDALTDYELLCLVVKFLNDVIANQNEQNASITRMYESFLALQTYVNNTKDTLEDAFNELDDYVRNYFDNLDVQEEINNKLDKYVEDGTLENIIASYLQTQKIYNTHAEMVANSSNLVNGLTVQTLGYSAINDDGGAFYKITSTEPSGTYYETLGENLYALLIADYVKPEMFGAYGDDIHDDSTAIQTAFDSGKIVEFSPKTYLCFALTTNNSLVIHGNGATLKRPQLNIEPYNMTASQMKWIQTITIDEDCSIKDLTFDNNCFTMWQVSDGYAQEQAASLIVKNGEKKIYLNIDNCHFKNSAGDGLHIVNNVIANISNCTSEDCFRGGFVATGYGSEINLDGWDSKVITTGVNDGFDVEVDSSSSIDPNTFILNINNVIIDYDLDIMIPKNGKATLNNIIMRDYDNDTHHGFIFGSLLNASLSISNSLLRSGIIQQQQIYPQGGDIQISNCKIVGNTTNSVLRIAQYQTDNITVHPHVIISNCKIKGKNFVELANLKGTLIIDNCDVECTDICIKGINGSGTQVQHLVLQNSKFNYNGLFASFLKNQYAVEGIANVYLYNNIYESSNDGGINIQGYPVIYFDNTPFTGAYKLTFGGGANPTFLGSGRVIVVPTATDLTFRGFVPNDDIAIALDTKKRYRYISGTTWNEIT